LRRAMHVYRIEAIMIVPGCPVRKKETLAVELQTGPQGSLPVISLEIIDQALQRHEHVPGMKPVDPALIARLAVAPRPVVQLPRQSVLGRAPGRVSQLIAASKPMTARQQLGAQHVHVVNPRPVQRRVAEPELLRISDARQVLEYERATPESRLEILF